MTMLRSMVALEITAVALATGSAGSLAALAAQTVGGDQGVEAPKIGCFRGRPLPACKSFWIVEMQGTTPLAQTTRQVAYSDGLPVPVESYESQLEWNLGHMANLNPKFALGGVITLGTPGGSLLSGIKARARRWLNDDVSIELEGGWRTADQYPRGNGATADLRLNVRDQGSFFLAWDGKVLPRQEFPGSFLDPGGFAQAFSVGAGLGSVPALVGTGALGLGVLIVLAILISDPDFN